AVSLLILSTTPAWGQQAATPGAVQRSLDRAVSPPVARETPPEAEKPAQPAREAVPAGGKRFLVKRFNFRGNQLFTSEQLRGLIADAEGQQLTLAEIYAVADRLTDHYRKEGFSLAVVTVPAQKVASGEVLLEVVEGRVGKTLFKGETRYAPGVLDGRVQGLEKGSVLHFDTLERELLLLNDLPGLVVRSVIEPGEEFGTSDVTLNVAEKRYEARVGVDNFGRESVGEWRVNASGAINNPTGAGDQVTAGVTHTESGLLTSYSVGYNRPLGNRGGRLSLVASHSEYDVGDPLEPGQLGGESDTYSLSYSYPFIRSRKQNLLFDIGIRHMDPEQDGTACSFIDEGMTLIDAGMSFQQIHPGNALTTAGLRVATNFNEIEEVTVTDCTGTSGTAMSGDQALRLEVTASHEQPIAPGWSVFGRFLGVYSPDELNDLQKFSLGGPASVRAYLVTEVSGDTGADASLELRRFFVASRNFPGVARVFVDGGWAKCRDDTPCYQGNKDETSRTGWGVGLTLFPYNRYTVEAQWAQNLGNHESADGDEESRFWVNLTMDL
ncbi:MAG TPA: ShlB/FhaC/HecB family hemolysin secretion/activation protein, partial [Gammaproteobacteria bacterium]